MVKNHSQPLRAINIHKSLDIISNIEQPFSYIHIYIYISLQKLISSYIQKLVDEYPFNSHLMPINHDGSSRQVGSLCPAALCRAGRESSRGGRRVGKNGSTLNVQQMKLADWEDL